MRMNREKLNRHISIHDLTRRSTVFPTMQECLWKFQFTTSQGGRRLEECIYLVLQQFQFTTSQGGRLLPLAHMFLIFFISIHDLTRRSTLRQACTGASLVISIHDLTRRSTIEHSTTFTLDRSFQFTTSQGGRLNQEALLIIILIISIHDLTRRSTGYRCGECTGNCISIHDLTRRSTANIHNYCEYLYTLFSILYKPFLFTLFYF